MSSKTPKRFSRIAGLTDVERLRASAGTWFGLGRAGNSTLVQLVRHGVGTGPDAQIRVFDGDVVEEHNLIGTEYRAAHVGMTKAAATAEILREIDPRINVAYASERLTSDSLQHLESAASRSAFVGLAIDEIALGLDISDVCYPLCPVVMIAFGPRCDYAEVGFWRVFLPIPFQGVSHDVQFNRT